MSSYSGGGYIPAQDDRYMPAGIVVRGESMMPDGKGGLIHSYSDGELIYHYASFQEFLVALDENT